MSSTLYDALERAVKVLQGHPELAPTITVSQTDESIWVSPYIAGAPMTAILSWNDAMRDVEREVEVSGVEGGPSYSKITVRGFLEDVAVTAQAVTFQEVQGGRVTLAELRRLAKSEEPLDS